MDVYTFGWHKKKFNSIIWSLLHCRDRIISDCGINKFEARRLNRQVICAQRSFLPAFAVGRFEISDFRRCWHQFYCIGDDSRVVAHCKGLATNWLHEKKHREKQRESFEYSGPKTKCLTRQKATLAHWGESQWANQQHPVKYFLLKKNIFLPV